MAAGPVPSTPRCYRSSADMGSLTVSGSTVAVTISGNDATLNNFGTINQTGTGRAVRDNIGVNNLIVTNIIGALMQTSDADVIQMNKTRLAQMFLFVVGHKGFRWWVSTERFYDRKIAGSVFYRSVVKFFCRTLFLISVQP